MPSTYAVGLLLRPGPHSAGVGGQWWAIDAPNGDGISLRWTAAQLGATALYTATPVNNSPAAVAVARNSLIAQFLAGTGAVLVLLDTWCPPIRRQNADFPAGPASGWGPATDLTNVCKGMVEVIDDNAPTTGLAGGLCYGHSADLEPNGPASQRLVGDNGGTVVRRVLAGTAAPGAAAVFSGPVPVYAGQVKAVQTAWSANGFVSLGLAAIERATLNLAAMTAFAPNWCAASTSGAFTRHPDQTFGARVNTAGKWVVISNEIVSFGPGGYLAPPECRRADGFA